VLPHGISPAILNRRHWQFAGCLGWWQVLPDFAGTLTWRDLSGRNMDGTITGSAYPIDNWKIHRQRQCIYLNGSQYANAGGTTHFAVPNLTYMTWIRTLTASGAQQTPMCFGGTYGGGPRTSWEFSVYGLKINAYVRFSGGGVGVNSTLAVNTGEWVHVAVSVATPSIQIYINGRQDGSGSGSGTIVYDAGTRSMCLGVEANQAVQYGFPGWMDDARVYDRAMSSAEIQAIYLDGVNDRYEALRPLALRGAKAPATGPARWPWQLRRQRRFRGVR
jgi:hypothetical protein